MADTFNIDEILAQPPTSVLTFLEATLRMDQSMPDVNWAGIVEGAKQKVASYQFGTVDAEVARQWATVALHLLAHNGRLFPTLSDDARRLSALTLRASPIVTFGNRPSVPELSLPRLLEELLATLPNDPEAVRKLAANWETRPIEEIRLLRRIKNTLTVLRQLVDAALLSPTGKVEEWMSVAELLP
jgi:hypothetical protein